ncbi:hypothetical protein PS1_024444 [Malus domestica]|uniref:Uncharacterized protein n=1 Tax=Malus domestica TaxID=3750 RepID=A0A498HFD5_MALDO|nr:hypothetical protein DVH24_028194 [Malus domestica]
MERKWNFGCEFWRLILGLSLVYVAMCGFYMMVSGALKPIMSPEMVRNVSEKSWAVDDMNGRLRFLQKEMQGLVPGSSSGAKVDFSKNEIPFTLRSGSSFFCRTHRMPSDRLGIQRRKMQLGGFSFIVPQIGDPLVLGTEYELEQLQSYKNEHLLISNGGFGTWVLLLSLLSATKRASTGEEKRHWLHLLRFSRVLASRV